MVKPLRPTTERNRDGTRAFFFWHEGVLVFRIYELNGQLGKFYVVQDRLRNITVEKRSLQASRDHVQQAWADFVHAAITP